MKVSRLKPLNKIEIFQPRWHDRTVLLAPYKVGNENEVVFTKTTSLPGSYYITASTVKKYPLQPNGKMMCYAVPLDEFEPIERVDS